VPAAALPPSVSAPGPALGLAAAGRVSRIADRRSTIIGGDQVHRRG
jgi:hypothetical protein